jgi:hypothetical protein
MECRRYNERGKGVRERSWVYARARAQNGFHVWAGSEEPERCLDYEWPESLRSKSIRKAQVMEASKCRNECAKGGEKCDASHVVRKSFV